MSALIDNPSAVFVSSGFVDRVGACCTRTSTDRDCAPARHQSRLYRWRRARRRYTYRPSVGDLSLDAAGADLVGTATNLHRLQDIAGVYGAAGAGFTFVGGGQVATLQNQNGVVLTLRGAQVGFQASLGLGGMTLALR